MPVITNQIIQANYFTADIANAVLLYNRLRWYRSRTGPTGLFEAATDASVQAATMLGAAATPHQISGKTLSLRIHGVTVVDVVFADPDPVTTAQAAAEISSATALVTVSDDTGKLRITTVATGSGASIEVLSSDAAPYLGLAIGGGAVGLDQDTVLVAGTHEYFYTDQNSDPEFWYAVEFLHTVSGVTTGIGVPFPVDAAQHVPYSNTIVGFVRLADMAGNSIPGRRIAIFNSGMPNRVSGQGLDWSVARLFDEIETDRNGYAELRLLRGIVVDFNVVGTGFTRRIQVPDTGDGFDLLDPALVVDDEFGIQEAVVDFAIRTT